jgi:Antitoxin Phd_YefM, type II toxin-antitoxin system
MRVYSVTEARQKFAEVLDLAKTEDVVIRRRDGDSFVVSRRKATKSPFDVPGVPGVNIAVKDIVEAVRFSRAQPWRDRPRKQSTAKKKK